MNQQAAVLYVIFLKSCRARKIEQNLIITYVCTRSLQSHSQSPVVQTPERVASPKVARRRAYRTAVRHRRTRPRPALPPVLGRPVCRALAAYASRPRLARVLDTGGASPSRAPTAVSTALWPLRSDRRADATSEHAHTELPGAHMHPLWHSCRQLSIIAQAPRGQSCSRNRHRRLRRAALAEPPSPSRPRRAACASA